jgi:hypothetical protein
MTHQFLRRLEVVRRGEDEPGEAMPEIVGSDSAHVEYLAFLRQVILNMSTMARANSR